jgi:hypothetical protein
VAADEIFILILIVVCVASFTALEIRSRRRTTAAADVKPPLLEDTDTADVASSEPVPSKNADRRKRRRR